ncbi:ribonucleoside triphosphate reductase [Fusibacter ferrireducens]|uniref:Ribonucleoside triphosphate reductase n=1 Tax=Fusibacter ferrireducens TaxID=2785058 RepID=A0ABS0A077_9FIRM|nr:ribonucleoside triphosphate reductase [Fusibacter ferrireducens]MBF4696036.1 ribonucleoside triphosphate reductase [Fusibacter ferrireducens]
MDSTQLAEGKMIDSKRLVDLYLKKEDWQVKENSNSPYSFGALNKYIAGEVSKDYWLSSVYTEEIAEGYVVGDYHIHDLGGITLYCCGYSLRRIIQEGVKGVPNIPRSSPAKHFASILNQLANLITVFQNEIMGAVAFSSVDTYLAPFIKEDQLSYEEVKQNLQNFIFSINSNSRGGAEPAFSNITLDLTPPKDLIDMPVFHGNRLLDYSYRACQSEMDMFNRAFYELMQEGDADGKPFAYPIPTYNIHERFDFDNPLNDALWEMAGKFGYPYFANFLNSDMKPEDARSMCCRLRIDVRELERKNGGLFGAGESTGSIGVVTLNLPRYGYLSKNRDELFKIIDKNLVLAMKSLEIKRAFLQENVLERGLIPAFKTYVGGFENHFATIGLVGLNEMCENFLGKSILTEEGKMLSMEVLEYMRERLRDFQEETGNLYNLEATPAESTAYRLALKDKFVYPDIITQGNEKTPYYTNSCHIPVNQIESIKQVFEHQNDIQVLFTGGTVVHVYLGAPITGTQAKQIIKTVCETYKVPYVSLSPVNHYCPDHGYLNEAVDRCPKCHKDVEKYQRITGYLRNVKYFNEGKREEFSDRHQL